MSFARVRIFNRQRREIAEIHNADVKKVEWVLNGIGKASVEVPWSSPACTKDILSPNNFVLVQFDNGLPDWGGILDYPRTRKYGSVGIKAYSMEKLLNWRVTDYRHLFTDQTAGQIIGELLRFANQVSPTGIQPGNLYEGGPAFSWEKNLEPISKVLTALVDYTGHDFYVRPSYANQLLLFHFDWYQRMGKDRSGQVELRDGERGNVEIGKLDEQGPVWTRVHAVGKGNDFVDPDRPYAFSTNITSQGLYGLRELPVVLSDIEDQPTIEAVVAQMAVDKGTPRYGFTATAENAQPALFSAYGVGDIVKASFFVDSSEWNYTGNVRLIGRQWKNSDQCELKLEDWTAAV